MLEVLKVSGAAFPQSDHGNYGTPKLTNRSPCDDQLTN